MAIEWVAQLSQIKTTVLLITEANKQVSRYEVTEDVCGTVSGTEQEYSFLKARV